MRKKLLFTVLILFVLVCGFIEIAASKSQINPTTSDQDDVAATTFNYRELSADKWTMTRKRPREGGTFQDTKISMAEIFKIFKDKSAFNKRGLLHTPTTEYRGESPRFIPDQIPITSVF